MLRRVLRGLPERAKVCVLNDEAHHCYLPEEGRRTGSDKDENKSAALWFSALAALRDEGRLGRVHDFSATPMFIQTTASARSEMFPWVTSDFPLMDGIESGLVKIPRVPVDDDSDDREVVWRNLYRNTNPKTIRSDSAPPSPLGDALGALYEQYTEALERWSDNGLPTPPVLIVVANNIANAESLYHHIAGWTEHTDDGAVAHRPRAVRPVLEHPQRRVGPRRPPPDPARPLEDGRRRRHLRSQPAGAGPEGPKPPSCGRPAPPAPTATSSARPSTPSAGRAGWASRSAAWCRCRCSPRGGTRAPSSTSWGSGRSAPSCCASR